MAVIIFVFATLAFVYLARKLYKKLAVNLPPGPRPWPVVGNIYDIKPLRCQCFDEWSRAYGPIISVWIGSTLNVIVSNTDLAKEVLTEKDQVLADRHRSRSAAKFSRDGKDLIWADYGPHYVKVRRFCTMELFSPKRLEALRPIREDEVTAMVESIFKDCTNSGKSMMVRNYLGAVTFNNITRLVFGKRFVNEEGVLDEQGKEFKAIVENGLKLGGSLAMAEHIPWLRWLFPLEEGAFAKHGARRDRLTRAILEEHRQALEANKETKQQHFVEALLTLREEYDLSDDTVIGLLWDMITAGMDTTAITVEWAMAELVKNPRIQQMAQEELDRVIGPLRVMTELDLPSLPYLQCIVKESLRLHPPNPLMLPHRASADVKVGGFDIPKGTNVHVNVWAMARDPAIWKRPTEFLPERFLEEDVDVKGHDFRLLPFGAGRRICPGAGLGVNLAASMLGHLLHHFMWGPPEGMKPEEVDLGESPGMVTFMRRPLEAVSAPRLPHHLYGRTATD
ncbi:hypothetical protein SAY86_000922 [Trapa natans]|uniref:Uncharacterized protein n=1 Tax=Trapa natans TaxID=22666 RepID=A0AAN7MBR7_TRANT|nr:hypothetical protein SAY86_000922 [Trapa natans]